MKKLGIVGFGYMAANHHVAMVGREDIPFAVEAVYDIDPARLEKAREMGFKTYDTLDAFLQEGEYDLVLVSTANNYHCEIACRAMEAGFHVMVEKPAARSSAEIRKMIETSERTGRLFTVHHNRRFDPDFLNVWQILKEGTIGKPYMIESRIHSANGSGCMYNWRGMEDHGGGMVMDWGVHLLDQILYMIEEPVKTVSATVRPLWSDEVDNYSKIIITFESGLTAHVEVVTYSPITLPRWLVYGDRGALQINEISGEKAYIRRIKEDSMQLNRADAFEDYKVVKRDQKVHQIREFEECKGPAETPANFGEWHRIYNNIANVLDGKEELIVKPEQVLRVMTVIEAAFRSSKEGITVQF